MFAAVLTIGSHGFGSMLHFARDMQNHLQLYSRPGLFHNAECVANIPWLIPTFLAKHFEHSRRALSI